MADSQIGRTLGSYRLVERIGVGGMGVVFRAVHLKLGREAAVKILPETLVADQNFLRRFEREAANAAALHHNNILAVWEYGEEQGVPYLVMPYIGGGTLRHELADGPLSPQEAVGYLRQIADALDYAHGEGIIHRDVKPANLLLDERKQVILGDFGIAKALEGAEGLTRTGVGVGTPEYMAPEQAQGRADSRSDLYALGVVLYQMLTGRVPYSGNSTVEVLMKHLQDPLPMLPLRSVQPALPPGVERVIQTALAKNPNERYQTAKALVDALEGALSSGPPQAYQPPYDQLSGGNQPTAYAHTMPYGSPPPTTPPTQGGGWAAPTPLPPATPASLPLIPLQQTQTPYQAPQPYHTPMPQQSPAPPQPLAGGYATAPASSGGGNRLLIGALGGVAVLLLLCLTSVGAYALFRPDATPTPRPTVNAAATSTAAAAVAASLSATQTAGAPTPTVLPTPTILPTATIPPLPTPTIAAAASAAPTATAPRPPTATRAPTAVASIAPIGEPPAGWKTYNGHANAPFSLYYPPDWTIDEDSAKDGIIYVRPPSGASTWMLIATTGKAETNGNIDVLRDQYYNNTLGECTKKAIDRTNYSEYTGITFAGLGATCETTSGLTYARIGIGLKGQVPWRYRLNAPYGDYSDALDKYFVPMLNSLNIYKNP